MLTLGTRLAHDGRGLDQRISAVDPRIISVRGREYFSRALLTFTT